MSDQPTRSSGQFTVWASTHQDAARDARARLDEIVGVLPVSWQMHGTPAQVTQTAKVLFFEWDVTWSTT